MKSGIRVGLILGVLFIISAVIFGSYFYRAQNPEDIPWTKQISILSKSMGNVLSRVNEEKPVPKSSMAIKLNDNDSIALNYDRW